LDIPSYSYSCVYVREVSTGSTVFSSLIETNEGRNCKWSMATVHSNPRLSLSEGASNVNDPHFSTGSSL